MLAKFRSALTYANVVATMALFIALGGGAYAAVKLPKNSVGPTQIKKDAVRSSEVKNRSLRAADFKAGQLPAGSPGVPGQRGPQGVQGPKGATGGPGPTVGAASGPADPPAGEITPLKSVQVTTTQAGPMFVLGRFDAGSFVDCYAPIGNCAATAGLYVDGVPVPGTAVSISCTAGNTCYLMDAGGTQRAAYQRWAVTAGTVRAGRHTVSLAYKTTAGLPVGGYESAANANVGALALGG